MLFPGFLSLKIQMARIELVDAQLLDGRQGIRAVPPR